MRRWALTLRQQPGEELESRLARIVRFLSEIYPRGRVLVSDFEATGPLGDELTQRLDAVEEIEISALDLIGICEGAGQVIELDATLTDGGDDAIRLIVRDGTSVDVLGKGSRLPKEVVGAHDAVDPRLFGW
ncbi:MAG: hypothetical protein ACRDNI_12250 [Gaiellaceae bacterium]